MSDSDSSGGCLIIVVVVILVSIYGPDLCYSKLRYSLMYSLDDKQIWIQDKPHDCDFLRAPLGRKECHFNRTVMITRTAKSAKGDPIVSWDDGKHWQSYSPDAGETVPEANTVRSVSVGWDKEMD